MEKTGERYAAARRMLVEQAAASERGRTWQSEPEMGDDAVREATGRGWDEWCDLIDAWPGRVDGHAAIARWLGDEHGVDAWWRQGVTVGYERITGLRLPHQMADGTFSASKSRTVVGDAELIGKLLRSDADGPTSSPATPSSCDHDPSRRSCVSASVAASR